MFFHAIAIIIMPPWGAVIRVTQAPEKLYFSFPLFFFFFLSTDDLFSCWLSSNKILFLGGVLWWDVKAENYQKVKGDGGAKMEIMELLSQ